MHESIISKKTFADIVSAFLHPKVKKALSGREKELTVKYLRS